MLVTTLTKKMAEELTDFLGEAGVRVRYLHSDVDTLRRVELLTELRAGVYDVLVGINLLREGLDLPEVSLVAILDADKEGFLRSSTSLIQTIGRAARNVSGEVHMYADVLTDSMKSAIDETTRRREKQVAYNRENGIDPQPLRKRIADITEVLAREEADTAALLAGRDARKQAPVPNLRREGIAAAGANDLEELIRDLNEQMLEAAGELKFELAAAAARRGLRPQARTAADGESWAPRLRSHDGEAPSAARTRASRRRIERMFAESRRQARPGVGGLL